MNRVMFLILALVAGMLIAHTQERLPDPRPATAPPTVFSAERAMVDVAAMSRKAHPIGSAANARVRDHLIDRMVQLGLSPQIRSGVGVQQFRRAPDTIVGGPVENLVGVLPGKDRSAPAIALMSHYDSVPNSPGAADDAAGVAASLEIVRAIKARGVPARDVILLITDGEEAGLLGADAFFHRDPMAKRIGLVLNMEARGSGGRAQMFQTSADNGGLIDLLRQGGVRPAASSLTVFVYQQMPNDTDLTETLEVGIPGMNYAFIGGQFDYHAATSTAAWLDVGSLQDIGQEVLGAAARAAFAKALPAKRPSEVFAATFEGWIVAYPAWAGWGIVALAGALIAVAARTARRLEPFPWTDPARGAAGLIFAAGGTVAMMQLARHLTGVETGYLEQRFLLAQFGRWEWAAALITVGFVLLTPAALARGKRLVALLPLVAGAACSAFGALDKVGLIAGAVATVCGLLAFGRPVSRPGGWIGVLLLGLLLATIAQALAPPAAHVLGWPLLAASLAAALTAAAARGRTLDLAILGALAALALGWIAGLAHGAFQGLDLMPLLGLPALLLALTIWPLAQPADGAPPARWIGPLLLVAGFAVAAWVRYADPYDPRHPETSYVVYQMDQDAQRGWRVSLTPDLPDWSRSALGAEGGAVIKHKAWTWSRPVDATAAPTLPIPAPAITLTREADGRLRLRAAPVPGARAITLSLTAAQALSVETVAGVPVKLDLKAGQAGRIAWMASAEGIDMVLRSSGPGKLDVKYASRLDQWPAALKPLPPRPADVAPFGDSDTALVTGTRAFSW